MSLGASRSPSGVTDTFATPYTWTVVENPGLSDYSVTAILLVGTGGAGTSGTVTVTGASGGGSGKYTDVSMAAIPLTGASLLSGLSIVSSSGYVDDTGTSTTSPSGPSISSTVAGCAAIWVLGDYASTSTITAPGPPWSTIVAQGAQPGLSIVGQLSPAVGTALDPTWTLAFADVAASMGVLILPPPVPVLPPPIRVYSQAVQRASAWMKRESGLWSPESGLIPRAA